MVTTAPQAETRLPTVTVPPLRIVFFGTPGFAVPTLDALLAASPHTVVGVVTQPDRPRGRGQNVSDAPVKAHAVAAGLPWRTALDHLIVEFSKRAISRLDPEIVEILRLSAYQLLHLTRVPASAVVDDAVNLAGRVGKRSASGFVNAVLRTISRRRGALRFLNARWTRPIAPRRSSISASRSRAVVDRQRNVVVNGLKSLQLRADAVTAEREGENLKIATAVGHDGLHRAALAVSRDDLHARQLGARLIRDGICA